MRWSPKRVSILRRDEWLKRERRRQQTTTNLTRTLDNGESRNLGGRTRQVFETVSSLPRNQQEKIVDMVDVLVAQISQRTMSERAAKEKT